MVNGKSELVAKILAKHPQVELSEAGHLHVPVSYLVNFMQDLKNSFGFNLLTNLTSVDYKEYMTVVYDVCIAGQLDMLHIISKIDRDKATAPSMVPIWGGANWQEREVYDLMGIVFTGHPNMKRILMDYDYEGHPLRKDFEWESGRE